MKRDFTKKYKAKEILTSDRKMQCSSFFENPVQGMLSGIHVNEDFTDEQSRDSSIDESKLPKLMTAMCQKPSVGLTSIELILPLNCHSCPQLKGQVSTQAV